MNNYINKSIISILVFIFFFYLFLILSTNYFPLNRHWSSIYDNELTIAYNALLFNSGKLQEFTDHSGYLQFYFYQFF